MKISVMVGSLRKNSFNRMVYNNYRENAPEGVEFMEVDISKFPLYDSDLHKEKFPKEIMDAANIIHSSDGILFFSPEYNYSIPGVLKNAIDWISRLDMMPFDGKKCSIIGASPGNLGTARMQYDLRKCGVFLNMFFMNRPEVMIARCHEKFDDSGKLTDSHTVDYLEKHINAFRKFISE